MTLLKVCYLFRLDDACSQMNRHNWHRMECLLDRYNIKPLVGIIPANEDPNMVNDSEDPDFWGKMKKWQEKGWQIAMHGYNHVCNMELGGVNPVHNRSEFAGLSIEKQMEKIRKGYNILVSHGLLPKFFFAPSHTFDNNTLKALSAVTPIRRVSDTYSLTPYRDRYNITFIPCQMGKARTMMIPGYWTICLHPNHMLDDDFYKIETFINRNRGHIVSFDQIPLESVRRKSVIDRLIHLCYFGLMRRMRK